MAHPVPSQGPRPTHDVRCPNCNSLLARVSSGVGLIELACIKKDCRLSRIRWDVHLTASDERMEVLNG